MRSSAELGPAWPLAQPQRGLAFLRRLRRESSAATVVEFALLFPVIWMVLLGIFEGGLFGMSYLSLREGAYEGTQVARFTSKTDADIRAAVEARAGFLQLTDGNITITPAYPRRSAGIVTVSVTYQYQPIPIPGTTLGSAVIPLVAQATAQVE